MRENLNYRVVFGVALIGFLAPLTLRAASSDPIPAESAVLSRAWLDVDGNPLPFETEEEVLEFLRTAEVVSSEPTPQGITKPLKVLLEKDGIQAHAVFRSVDVFKREWRGERGLSRKNFRDSFRYECAAYELSRMLGLHRVPPVVLREHDRQEGSMQLWAENVITDQDRMEKDLSPPNPWRWNMERQLLDIFDNLVFNDDRNKGNILIDSEWQLLWIDHTRAFRVFSRLPDPEKIQYCERPLWERLLSLDPEEVNSRLDLYLDRWEISTLLKRHKALIRLIQELIQERGERMVLFSFF